MSTNRSPWAWIPTLYLAQGLPYVIVMTISVIMYKRLGLDNTDIALYTSWLYLPWVIKPLWSPFVDIFRTKRWWTLSMQLLLGIAFASVAFTLSLSSFLQWSIAAFALTALLLRDPRHRIRRLLYARPQRASAVNVCWDTHHASTASPWWQDRACW